MARGGLLERDGVTEAVAGLVGAVSTGRPGALFVVGEAGLGKTALLGRGCSLAAAAGLSTGFGRGHPMEGALPFGVLVQVLDDVGGHGLLREDRPGATSGDDRASRFFSVLRWLERRDGQPTLLVVDDLHWADADSLALAVFLCRRMSSLRAGLLASLRPWPVVALESAMGLAQEGCARLERLAPLTSGAATSLLETRVGRPVPAEVSRRAGQLCAGNPLLLEQMAMAIGRGEDVPDTGGASRSIVGEGLLLARFAGLPAAGMRCARAASVLGTRFVPGIAAQVAGLDGAEIDTALESLGRSGLIVEGPGPEAAFIHPLFRQALYDDLGAARRAQLHARAFTVFAVRGMDAAAAEHAIQANLAGDMDAVAVLERAGRAARRSGALGVAVARLDAAVAMAAGRAGTDLLLAQGEARLAGGRPDRAADVYQELLERPGLPTSASVQAWWMLGRARAMTGAHDQGHAAFCTAADLAEPDDPGTAVEVLLDAAFTAMLTAGPVRALPVVSRARELAGARAAGLRTRADAHWGEIALQAGNPAGMAAAEPGAPWLGDGGGPDAPAVGWSLINAFAYSALLVERLTDADRAFTEVRATADRANDPLAMAMLAISHGYTLTRMGRLDEALTAVRFGRSLVELVPMTDSWSSVGIAYIQLYRGDLDDSDQWCQLAHAAASARGELNALLFAWDVLGHRKLREGAVGEACEFYSRLEATVHQMGIGEPSLPPWPRHAISAYLAAGRISDAERVLHWVQIAARSACPTGIPGSRWPQAGLSWRSCGVTVTRPARTSARPWRCISRWTCRSSTPRRCSTSAVSCVATASRPRHGGYWRRRSRWPRAPRRAGWPGWPTQNCAWLAGGAAARERRELTAQEGRVAALAATGASNPQIARQLSVSVSTVETHLERVYAKLGIGSRHGLIAMAAARGDLPWDTGSAGVPAAGPHPPSADNN